MSGSGFKKLTIKEAEKHIGGRLDRRRKYFLWNFHDDGQPIVCHDSTFLVACSGCLEMGDYGSVLCSGGWDEKRKMEIGCGCEECGYTGVRRGHFPVPAETIR
ncbi:MAG TPA: hypothetical protein DHV36_09565 [Desulfobacteraceae bacterium]|nr:hypothetical protein [Desulfobacteraceae bacterium]|tara:strand:- start:755 stop:1063 length:309 start_codon:yes stop_codon:yes gene_type:complete